MRRLVLSRVIVSPFFTSAIAPPTNASGATCPTSQPHEPPENRPSVTSATESSSPCPISAAVGERIYGMPGPPFGPTNGVPQTEQALYFFDTTAIWPSCTADKTQ